MAESVFVVTGEWIHAHASYHGPQGNSWKKAQTDLLGVGAHRGWIERAIGVELSNDDRKRFEFFKDRARKKKPPKRNIDDKQKQRTEPDWEGKCAVCGESPVHPVSDMCGPCTFGEADTAGGNW